MKKNITFLVIILLLLLAGGVWEIAGSVSLPEYTEAEITDQLCLEIVQRDLESERPVRIIARQQVDNALIVGYAAGEPYQRQQFGYLQFVIEQNSGRYRLARNQRQLLDTYYRYISVDNFMTEPGADGLLKPYYVILGCCDDLQSIEVWEEENGAYQPLREFVPEAESFMCIWEMSAAGKYVFWREDGAEWFCRYFVSLHQNAVLAGNDSLTLLLAVDYADLPKGGQVNIGCWAELAEASNPAEYDVSGLTLRQTSRPGTVWLEVAANGAVKGGQGALASDFGICGNSLLNNIAIPQEYTGLEKNALQCSYLWRGDYSDFARSAQINMNKKFYINEPGQYFAVHSLLADFFGLVDAENDLLQDNNLQFEWLIEVQADKATQTYVCSQNVPVIIK